MQESFLDLVGWSYQLLRKVKSHNEFQSEIHEYSSLIKIDSEQFYKILAANQLQILDSDLQYRAYPNNLVVAQNMDEFGPDDTLVIAYMEEPVIMDYEGNILRKGVARLRKLE